MSESFQELSEIVEDVPSLRGVFITAMPDCLLYDAWTGRDEEWQAEEAASYFGDLIRANREGLKALHAWSAEMQITIESADVLLLIKEIREDFLVTLAFERKVPLGMARLHAKRVLERVAPTLPSVEAEERPRGLRIVEFLEKYAPDAHAALNRVALRTGIRVEALRDAATLGEDELTRLEGAVKDILGLDHLSL